MAVFGQAEAEKERRAFIVVGGVQPKKVKVDGQVHQCPHCHAQALRWVRQDLYLSFFFLPVFPFKTGEPYLECDACGQVFHAEQMPQAQALAALRPLEPGQPALEPSPPAPVAEPEALPAPSQCRFCDRELSPDFKYCPYRGARI